MKLLLVDPSSIFRMGMSAALAAAPRTGDLAVVGECGDGATACALAVALGPDVVVTDLHLRDRNGSPWPVSSAAAPALRVLILTSHGPEAIVHQALGAGAGGYASRGSPRPRSRGDSERRPRRAGAAAGRGPAARRGWPAAATETRGAHAIERLSQRERQIFDLVDLGKPPNKQIAGRLGISIKTVETHRGHINGKLRVHTSADIVRLASLWGLFLAAPARRAARPQRPAATERCRSSRGRSLVAAAAYFLSQRLAGDAEVLGGERAVAAADLQHAADVAELDLLERRDRGGARSPAAAATPAPPARRPPAPRGRCAGRNAVVVVQQRRAAITARSSRTLPGQR